jgi:ankyrin repeat protein
LKFQAVLFLAGYNHYEIAQFLLENGSDPNAIDKGGLIGNFDI